MHKNETVSDEEGSERQRPMLTESMVNVPRVRKDVTQEEQFLTKEKPSETWREKIFSEGRGCMCVCVTYVRLCLCHVCVSEYKSILTKTFSLSCLSVCPPMLLLPCCCFRVP